MFVTLGIVFLLSLADSGFGDEDICDSTDFRRIRACHEALGFSQVVSDDVVMWNTSALTTYCRAPNRTKGEHCVGDYKVACPMGWGPANTSTFNRRKELLLRILDHTCSEVEVLESNRECLEKQARLISDCFLEASDIAEREMADRKTTLTDDAVTLLIKRTGQSIQKCVFKVLKANCEKSVRNVIANFLYGFFVSVFDA